ncbi:MAG TPA: hypothetical protein VD761_08595 [Solirubrobacterales bacterium]|nr:hypothetical protein [Solirubrobacterales bacterium]
MARALGLAVAFLLLLAPSANALSEPSGDLVASSEETVLRLHDLPPGYQVSDDVGCGPSLPFGEGGEPEGRLERRFLKWSIKYWPEGCFYEYEQIFKVPGLGPAPPLVEAETRNTPSEAAAVEGLELYNALLDRPTERGDRGLVTISPTGVQARLIRDRNALVDGEAGQAGSFLIWRHGKLLAFLIAAGLDPSRNDSAAIHFAGIQQQRLDAPSPYTEAERDDSEVRLDDPGLKFPIYWVGNPFRAGDGPPVALEDAYARNIGPPGQKFQLGYSPIDRNGFEVGGWTRRSWKRFQRSDLGDVNRVARCTRTTKLDLEQGSAVIYGAYDGKRLRPCPSRAPERYYAIARIGRMVIGVNLGNCLSCAPGYSTGAYNTLGGMKAIVRALALRPRPVY